jgi:hypothetical protein
MTLNKIIFAIDKSTDLHAVAKFMRHMDTARAMGTMKGSFTQCVGMYAGLLEPSYMVDEVDYRKVVVPLGVCDGQESVMHVPADTRQPCTLEFTHHDEINPVFMGIGPLHEVTAFKALSLKAWTYVLETGKYFTTEETK